MRRSQSDLNILNLVSNLYGKEFRNICERKYYPKQLYILLLSHNEVFIFEELLAQENENLCSEILMDSFVYCLKSNLISIIFYFIKKYGKEMGKLGDQMVNAILENLNEYTETDGAKQYHQGVYYYEEKLFILEIIFEWINQKQAQKFFEIMKKLAISERNKDPMGFSQKTWEENEMSKNSYGRNY